VVNARCGGTSPVEHTLLLSAKCSQMVWQLCRELRHARRTCASENRLEISVGCFTFTLPETVELKPLFDLCTPIPSSALLEKIYSRGQSSLSAEEKAILECWGG
jgi:hypothetical protein